MWFSLRYYDHFLQLGILVTTKLLTRFLWNGKTQKLMQLLRDDNLKELFKYQKQVSV